MFGHRTPMKKTTTSRDANMHKSPTMPEKIQPTQTSNVRRSIGEWETAKPGLKPKSPNIPQLTASVAPARAPQRPTPLQADNPAVATTSAPANSSPPKQSYLNRTTEAKACLTKAKLHLSNSRNLKTEIKNEVLAAISRLYELVRESERERASETVSSKNMDEEKRPKKTGEEKTEQKEIREALAEHSQLLKENTEHLISVNAALKSHQEKRDTFASIAASTPKWQPPVQTTLHSVVVTSKDEMDTGEQVLGKMREAMNAKEGWIKVEKLRKAKDRKIIVGCKTVEDRERVKDRLKKAGKELLVDEVHNKDPLLILRDVLTYNTDEDVLTALRNQNGSIFQDLEKSEDRVAARYRTKARNPHACHIVLRVSPKIWQRALEAETLYIDLQRVKVADQSPLVQCSLCLGYGHSRRYCSEGQETCSHCGGPHMRTRCELWRDGASPSCCNCKRAKLDQTDHSAFSRDCAVRKRWDALARATTAYSC